MMRLVRTLLVSVAIGVFVPSWFAIASLAMLCLLNQWETS